MKHNPNLHRHPHHLPLPKKDVVLKLELSEIKFDVQFDSWLRNRVFNQILRNNKPDADNVSYNFEASATDWLARQIDNCIGDIHGELNWCVCQQNEENLRTDELNGIPDEWFIHLQFNDDWMGSPRAMNSKAHQYVVAQLLYKWNKACDKMDTAMAYKAEADDALESLYFEARSERVSPMPFRL